MSKLGRDADSDPNSRFRRLRGSWRYDDESGSRRSKAVEAVEAVEMSPGSPDVGTLQPFGGGGTERESDRLR